MRDDFDRLFSPCSDAVDLDRMVVETLEAPVAAEYIDRAPAESCQAKAAWVILPATDRKWLR